MALNGIVICCVCKKECLCLIPDIGKPICYECIKKTQESEKENA